MEHLIFFGLLIWISFVMAKLEINIEGENGWAKNLPTWRLPPSHWVSKVFFGGKEATGYHLWLNLFEYSFVQLVFVFIPFSWNIEFRLISFVFLLWVIEDFLWFLINPKYGIRKFNKKYIPWHERVWWIFAPRDYFILASVGILFYLLSFYVI